MNRRELLKTLPAAMLALPASAAPRQVEGGKARIKTALCAYSFRDALGANKLSYEDLVDMAVENRVDGLDLTVYWFPKENLDKFYSSLRRKAYVSAVEIPAIAIRSDLCQKRANDQQREAAWLNHWVDAAERLGAGHIRIFGGEVPDGASEDEAAKWVTEILKRSADYAGSKGVILGLENHGGITLHAKRIIQIVEAVDHPFVGINLDTGNFRSDPYEQIETCIPYAVNSQYKVNIREGEGREQSDWDRITKMFASAGYKGYISLEYEAEEDPFTAVPRHLKTMNELAKKYSA
jgi:sugar phosphate isomerase/epimerase